MTRRGEAILCSRRGFVFALLLWIIAALAALAVSLAAGVRTDMQRAANLAADATARTIQDAAVVYLQAALDESGGAAPDASAWPCQAVRLGEGAFWVIAGDADADGCLDYGLRAEGGLLDLNAASQAMLAALPGASEQAACSILDWRDADDEPTGSGAESDYYLRLRDHAYLAANADFQTTLELRLVAGVDDDMLYGNDANLNGVLDAGEDAGSASLSPGLAALTSAFVDYDYLADDARLDATNASAADLQTLFAGVTTAQRAPVLAASVASEHPVNILQMVQTCGLTRQEAAAVEPLVKFTPTGAAMRLDLVAAPPAVMEALGMLDDADVAALVTARSSRTTPNSLLWVLDAALDPAKLDQLADLVLVGDSRQYAADIVSISADGRAFRRRQVVLDASGDSPRVVYVRDITALGWPLDAAIRQRLRAGEELDDVLADYD